MIDHNSLVLKATAYYHALFEDIAWLYGSSRKDLARDISRLLTHLGRHGMRVACIDLPACSKHFDQCLDRGQYQQCHLPLMGAKSTADRAPRFLGVLIRKVFDKAGKLRLDASVDCIAAIRQVYMGLKKLEIPCTQEAINDEVQQFLDIERNLRHPSLDWHRGWDSDDEGRNLSFFQRNIRTRDGRGRFCKEPSALLQERLGILHNVCDISVAMLGNFFDEEDHELPKHGPGATATGSRQEWKFHFDNWPERLDAYFPYDRYAHANSSMVRDCHSPLSRIELDSRLIVVPKTLKAPRLIAAEPKENQWCQQLVWNQLEARLRFNPISASIDFRSQERNQRLAQEGSKSGLLSTLDLSSASDRLSMWTIERCFRNNNSLLRRLWSCRTGGVSLKAFCGFPSRVTTKKFSTMGSACTFPVQSVIYSMMAISCVLQGKATIKSIREAAKKVQVFGDDIVIPKEKLPLLMEMLEYFQLKVNESKTYSGSYFRESCGYDAFRGELVAPTYIKHFPHEQATLGDLASLVPTSNNYYNNGYWRVAYWLREIAGPFWNIIQEKLPTSGDYGFSSAVAPKNPMPKHRRWNKVFQRYETKQVRQKCQTSLSVVNHTSSLLSSLLQLEKRSIVSWNRITNHTHSYFAMGMVPYTPFQDLLSFANPASAEILLTEEDTCPSLLRVGWTPLKSPHSLIVFNR